MKQAFEFIFIVCPLLLYWIFSGKMEEEHEKIIRNIK